MAVTGTPQSGSSAALCTADDVKTRLGLSTSDYDTMLAAIVAGITGIFESFCCRKLIQHDAAATEYFTGGSQYLQVNRYPIISITTIKEAWDYGFDSATALTADTDYRRINGGAKGILRRIGAAWLGVPDAIQIVYRGGFCPAGDTPGDGEAAVPAELRESAILQGCLAFKRRDDIGLSAVGFEGGSLNKFAAMKLLPVVEEVLMRSYRRVTL
jgi:hypothetical protein